MSVLKVDNLICGFGATPVVDVGSFNLVPGAILSVVGPNGGGKSTLLRTLCGRLSPVSGKVEVASINPATADARSIARAVTMLMQLQTLDPGITTEELVRLGRTPYLGNLGRMTRHDLDEVDNAIELCKLSELRARPLGRMSGGERQRARLAMVLAQRTPAMLLDEPTNHLDVANRYLFYKIVTEIRKERGCAIVMVSHSLEDARRFAGRIMLIDNQRSRLFSPDEFTSLQTAIHKSANVPKDWVY